MELSASMFDVVTSKFDPKKIMQKNNTTRNFPSSKALFYAVLGGVGIVVLLVWVNHLLHP